MSTSVLVSNELHRHSSRFRWRWSARAIEVVLVTLLSLGALPITYIASSLASDKKMVGETVASELPASLPAVPWRWRVAEWARA